MLDASKIDRSTDIHIGSISRRGLRGFSRCPEAPIYLCGNLAVTVVEIIAGARLVRKPPVNSHVLLTYLADKGLVALPEQLLDAVALADVGEEVKQGSVCGIIYLCSSDIAGDFDGDSAVVV